MHASDPARVISENAITGGDSLCRAALQRFCRIFGSVAGNLALTGMTTGGMFLGGGIPPKILPVLQAGHFMATFNAKGRFETFMERIPVRVILNDRAALMGAAYYALAQNM
jgi:glucokinase